MLLLINIKYGIRVYLALHTALYPLHYKGVI